MSIIRSAETVVPSVVKLPSYVVTSDAKVLLVLYSSTQSVSSPPFVQLNVAMVPSPGVRVAAKPVGLTHVGCVLTMISST